ncbi:serine/threonine-protein kinase [Actinomadura sediminis]|uniref:non-specific serine/threonine protein kinase n=1 Tax=Actinomadura sediminis TaxID=1038904 RepID=A0ABW3EKD6_9ACTN
MPHVIADRYEPVELLGRGGMGAVWRARDRVLDREVAIKEVTPPAGLDDEQIGRVYTRTFREARSAARLDHPGIVTVYDVVEEDGRPWIVMQLVRARSLAAIIKEEGPLPPERVAALGLDLLDALRTAHAAGVVHRDVKPGNVLLPPDRAVLTDFGIATVAGDETITQTGAIIGSPAYLAPEQARRQRASPASDLWSLGATLYAAVEGRSPYQRPDVWGVMGALLADEPDPPRRAGALAPVLHGLLRAEPGERAGHDEAERLLRRAAAGTPAPFAPPDSPAPVPPPPPHLTVDPGAGLPGGTPTSPPPGTVPPGTVPPGTVPPGTVPPGGVRTDGERHGPRWAVILPLGVFAVLLAAGVLSAAVFLTQSGEKNGRPGQAGSSAATASGNGSTGSPNVAVPAGYEPYRGPGFTVAVPKGWKAEASGDDVTFSDPAQGGRRGIAIQRIAENAADLGGSMADAAGRFENDTSYRDYRQVDFRRGFDYQGGDAAELEFTFTREGVAGRCRARVFRFNGAVYQTVLVTRADSWGQTVPYYETFLKTLRAE